MQRILAIADSGSGSQPALARAMALARNAGAVVHCVAFIYAPGLEARAGSGSQPGALTVAQIETARTALLQRRMQELTEALAAIGCDGVAVTRDVVWAKDVADWVNDHCAAQTTDLVIKTGHRSERWDYTPTDWRLLRECPAPVMVVASRSWKKRPRLLAALDLGSRKKTKLDLNRRVLTEARALADLLGAELHAVYVIEIPQVLADLDLIDPRRYLAEQRRALQPMVDALADDFTIPTDRFHLLPGQPHRAIPKLANKLKVDTVLLGTVGRRGVRARLLGNTAEAVLTHLRTDIVAIKPA
jgi:universal stress protein E